MQAKGRADVIGYGGEIIIFDEDERVNGIEKRE